MAKFKVGDRIKAGKGSNLFYSISNQKNNYVGVVLDVDGERILIPINSPHKPEVWVDPTYFDLIEEAKPEQAKLQYPKVIEIGKVKIVFNPPYTIVINGDVKGKAKCNPDDEYDPIVGLELAMSRCVNPYMKEKKTVYAKTIDSKWNGFEDFLNEARDETSQIVQARYEYMLQKQFEKELYKGLLTPNPIRIADIIKVLGK